MGSLTSPCCPVSFLSLGFAPPLPPLRAEKNFPVNLVVKVGKRREKGGRGGGRVAPTTSKGRGRGGGGGGGGGGGQGGDAVINSYLSATPPFPLLLLAFCLHPPLSLFSRAVYKSCSHAFLLSSSPPLSSCGRKKSLGQPLPPPRQSIQKR